MLQSLLETFSCLSSVFEHLCETQTVPLSLWLCVHSKCTVNKMSENRLFNCFMDRLV